MDKKKVFFISVLLLILLFGLSYTVYLYLGDQETVEEKPPVNPDVPALQDEKNTYKSRREAVDQLKEKKASSLPSLYDEIDDSQEDTDIAEISTETEDSQWTMDSWSFQKEDSSAMDIEGTPVNFTDTMNTAGSHPGDTKLSAELTASAFSERSETPPLSPEEEVVRQEVFFSYTHANTDVIASETMDRIPVAVLGTQKVAANSRLELFLLKESRISGTEFPAFSPIYGFVSFGPNRVFLKITNVDGHPVSLTAYDLQDGNEGIYVVNNFRAEASREILDDVIQDINIPAVPQVGGLKNLFRKQNRNIKVSIADHYRLILKPKS